MDFGTELEVTVLRDGNDRMASLDIGTIGDIDATDIATDGSPDNGTFGGEIALEVVVGSLGGFVGGAGLL